MKMKKWMLIAGAGLMLGLLLSCNKEEPDTEKPVIHNDVAGAFPKNCDTLYFGEPFTFITRFSDNTGLGSYSLEIHHNFDHHAHSTETGSCPLDPVKPAIHPFYFLQDYSIAGAPAAFDLAKELVLVASEGGELYEEGDYHFFIRLTDQHGWASQQGLNIKILHR